MTEVAPNRTTARVIEALRRRGPSSRVEVAAATGLARSTVTRVVQDLLDQAVLVEHGARRTPGRGRPRITLSLNPAIGQWIGLDFGLRHVRAALVDVSHQITDTAEVEVRPNYDRTEGLEAALAVAKDLTVANTARIVGIGAAVPGPVDPVTGEVARTSVIPRWAGHNVVAALSEAFGRPVAVDNDANCAALAEHMWGAAQNVDDFVYYKIHSGVGGGVILAGQLVRGRRGVAGEFGHVPLHTDGPICPCGGRGCLEAYAGVPAVLSQLSRSGRQWTMADLRSGAVERHSGVLRALEDAGRMLGIAAAATANTIGPDLIVCGGVLAEFGDKILAAARDSFIRQCITSRDVRDAERVIVPGALGRHATTLGAVAVAMAAQDNPALAASPE